MTRETQRRRRDALRGMLATAELDAVLVTGLLNVRYLTGFTGSNGAVLVGGHGQDVFVTDGRYVDQAATEVPDLERRKTRKLATELLSVALEREVRRLGVETHLMSVDEHSALVEAAAGRLEIESAGRSVERLRMVKDDTEVAALRTACQISTTALEALLAGRLRGRTERAIARDLEARMYAEGAEAVGFSTIVATGPHSAIPHHQPTDRPVEAGDLLKIDFGARYAGYHADCTRTVVAGREPQGWQREVYDLVAAAQAAGRAALAPDAKLVGVDAAARSVITDGGYGEEFTHGLGHGVGLQIHEDPFLGSTATGRLVDRTAVTVEPGVYLPGRGGVRIEDTLVVDAAGPQLLTTAGRDLLVVG